MKPDAVRNTPPSDSKPAAAEVPPADPPPAPTGWRVNGLWVVCLLLVLLGVYRIGWEQSMRWGMVILGLGFLIFIHELGHFLAAKWCDVHVQTFSIGFGPAIPGCSFRRGETLYKLAAIPLGGYVSMVGEGPEADEEENYPRSYKNKPVWQRMIIISAGVVMNLIFGAVAFITVYLWLGEERPTAVIHRVEAGSQAWVNGVRPGWRIVELDGNKDPWFDEIRTEIALTSKAQQLAFRFRALPGVPEAPDETILITPVRDDNNKVPTVGIAPSDRMQLVKPTWKKVRSTPALYSSAGAAALAFALDKDDVPLASTDPDKGDEPKPLSPGEKGWQELARRVKAVAPENREAFVLEVRGKDGKSRKVTAGPGFDFSDSLVATTDPATPDQPFNLKPLALDPEHAASEGAADPFDYRRRMVALAGKPIVIRVKRGEKGKGEEVDLFVPPAYHVTFGMRMRMGKVAAIRDDERTPARIGGLQENDVILGASVRYDGGPWEQLAGETADQKSAGLPLDPMRLPFQLYQRIHKDAKSDPNKWQVRLTVIRTERHNALARRDLEPMPWDDSWQPNDEAPVGEASPLSIPQLGLAYRVDSTVAAVEDDSPADKAGIQVGDEIRKIRFKRSGKTPSADSGWTDAVGMDSVRGKDREVYDQWAHYFWLLQSVDNPTVEVDVYRANARLGAKEMTARPDNTWPLFNRGVFFRADTRRQLAESFGGAITAGLDKTWRMTRMIYLSLRSMLSRRIDSSMVGGPITIASGAFEAANDLSRFLLLLGVISINLAVVNFLPIPVLDGGHMVFLLWEWVVGKPPPEALRVWATYAGLLLILALMLFVFYNDFDRMGWLPWKWKWSSSSS